MLPTTLDNVARQMRGECSQSSQTSASLVTGVVTDNRLLKDGDLFCAISGERVDGNRFAGDACARGAAGVVTQNKAAALAGGADPQRLIVVTDVYEALGNLAREQLKLIREQAGDTFKVVGITGSVGKTTTKDLLSQMLKVRGPLISPPGSFNNELGLPLTVLRADASTATLVLEMGAGAPGDIDYLTSIAQPDIAVVLIVARAHLGFIGGIDGVAREKEKLVSNAREGAPVILNGDDVRVVAMSEDAHGPITYFSARGHVLEQGLEADIFASDITLDEYGHPSFTLHTPAGQTPVRLALVGKHHVSNALAAASVAYTLGIPLGCIAEVLGASGPLSEHRMNVVTGAYTLIDDSYNANPDSMRAAIEAADHIAHGRRVVAVLGQMAELGDAHAQEHAALGSVLKEAGVSMLVAVGDGTDDLVRGAREAGVGAVEHIECDDAQRFLETVIHPDDVVLVKGSHSSGAWQIAEVLTATLESARSERA